MQKLIGQQGLIAYIFQGREIVKIILLKAPIFKKFHDASQSTAERVIAFERVFTEDQVEHRFLLMHIELPIPISHGELIKIC